MTRRTRRVGRAGQAVVLLLAVLVAMAVLALWAFDIHHFVMAKLRAQDGGDSAALAAARWQAAGLNLIGELNLIHAYMLADQFSTVVEASALSELQQRIALTTPMLALLSAQRMAEKNGMEALEGAADYLRDAGEQLTFDDTYEGAKEEFRAMLALLLREPIRAFPLTSLQDSSEASSWLMNQDFYEAVLARDWCWFWFNAYPFFQRYAGRGDFGQIPKVKSKLFFDLKLSRVAYSFDDLTISETMDQQLEALGHPSLPSPQQFPDPSQWKRQQLQRWATYDAKAWGRWTAMRRSELPLRAEVKDCYDYEGASVALSVLRDGSSWLAAAKAFGTVDGANPTQHELLLGGFNEVRLIPVDAADAGLVGFDLVWLRHLRYHLDDYLNRGLYRAGCRYCSALAQWDQPHFREQGLTWLRLYGNTCRRPKPGSGGGGGGAHFGH